MAEMAGMGLGRLANSEVVRVAPTLLAGREEPEVWLAQLPSTCT